MVEELSDVCADRLDGMSDAGSAPTAGEIEGCANSPSPKLMGCDAAVLPPCSPRMSSVDLPLPVILKILKIHAIKLRLMIDYVKI